MGASVRRMRDPKLMGMSRSGARREDVARSAKPPQRQGGPVGAPAARQQGSRQPIPGTGPDRIRQPLGWLPVTTFVLSVIGLADSSYQVYTHFSGTGLLGCSSNGDPCVLVQSSSYAWIFGIPVAVLGAAFYVAMVVICSPLGWRSRWPAVAAARLGAVVVGMIFVLYLVYRELVSIGQICPYCTSVHVITFLLFVLIVFAATGVVRTPTRKVSQS
jgi:uncharacterized membrane protein